MSERMIDRFRRDGLAKPLRTRPGILAWLFLFVLGPTLIAVSVVVLMIGNPFEQLAGLFLLGFSLFQTVSQAIIFLRSSSRGLIEFSERGIYSGLYRLQIPWSDVGPAWVQTINAGIVPPRYVLFVLRHATHYKSQLHGLERLMFRTTERKGQSKVTERRKRWTMAFGWLFREPALASDELERLEDMHRRLEKEDDGVILYIPGLHRIGLSCEEAVEIINESRSSAPGNPARQCA